MNRLSTERSPYLLQHKDNPVQWYPWGAEAFEKARLEQRPIFLSVGYSTCHWCHVMAHESFENPQIADVLNQYFVSIKVDREERPDVDRVYMTFVQVTTGSGGWPMSVWLTPALQPFYGGTYFPPTSRWGRPGFLEVLHEIARVWKNDREKVRESAETIVGRLQSQAREEAPAAIPGVQALTHAVQQFQTSFDQRRGGFGDAPKFPRPSELLFLLREHWRTGETAPRDMALVTLRAMALGGMRDHIGGGFHRYSVDGDWRVPHFEKMLYDQAQLILAYLEAAQASGDPFYAAVARDTLQYVARDLRDPAGGFYSAEDADSVPWEQATEDAPHKREGAFYVWNDAEIGSALGADAEAFRLRYGVQPDGNAPFDPQHEFTGKNLLYTARSLDEVASRTGSTVAEVTTALERGRAQLLQLRQRRPRPHLDDKILSAWNGLMIAACARAARVLQEDAARWCDIGIAAARFVRSTLWDANRAILLRRYRDHQAAIDGYAEDYAYLVFGLVELFETTGDPEWLAWALELQRRQDELFWDEADGAWFSTTGTDPSVLLRLKEDYDGAEPAASSVAVINLLALTALSDNPALSGRAERALASFGHRLTEMPRAVPMMLGALSTYHAGLAQVAIIGAPGDSRTRALWDALRARYLPTVLLIPIDPPAQDAVGRLLRWTGALQMRSEVPTVYLCRHFACQAPTTEVETFVKQLDELRKGS
jgi:uncharacterized protein YyaL (SSP411 family)